MEYVATKIIEKGKEIKKSKFKQNKVLVSYARLIISRHI